LKRGKTEVQWGKKGKRFEPFAYVMTRKKACHTGCSGGIMKPTLRGNNLTHRGRQKRDLQPGITGQQHVSKGKSHWGGGWVCGYPNLAGGGLNMSNGFRSFGSPAGISVRRGGGVAGVLRQLTSRNV